MYLKELREKISGSNEIQVFLKKRCQAREKKTNALERQKAFTKKLSNEKNQLEEIRSKMKAVILEGKDPESLQREENKICISIESLNWWLQEVENEILPSVNKELQAIEEELKNHVFWSFNQYKNDKKEFFNARLGELFHQVEEVEKALFDASSEIGAYSDFGIICLSCKDFRRIASRQ